MWYKQDHKRVTKLKPIENNVVQTRSQKSNKTETNREQCGTNKITKE